MARVNRKVITTILAAIIVIGGSTAVIKKGIQTDKILNPIIINAPDQAKTGDLITLSIKNPTQDSYTWLVIPPTKNFVLVDNGKKAIFSSGVQGNFKFIVAGKFGKIVDMVSHTITIFSNIDTDTEFDFNRIPFTPSINRPLSFKITEWCDAVKSKNKKQDCIKLARSFNNIAMLIESGTIETIEGIIKATRTSNRQALGRNKDNWESLGQEISREFSRMSEKGQLDTKKNHIEVWKEVAKALQEYAETL